MRSWGSTTGQPPWPRRSRAATLIPRIFRMATNWAINSDYAGWVLDTHRRPLRNLRISVTDRCNLRCRYCMPEAEYTWLPKRDLLTFEEISTLVDVFMDLGVDKVRLTGGEPLLRRDLPALVSMLSAKPLRDLALTTNGVLLAGHVEA